MKNLLCGLGTLALCLSLGAMAAPPNVNPEPMDLDVDIYAKIVKEKSKQSTIADGIKASADTSGSGDNPCGNVNINNNQSGGTNNSGIKDMFGHQNTTVVVGPVINMANCK